jgi:excisionase family DNA binding protein
VQAKLLLSIEEAAEQLNVGRTYVYGLLTRGEIRSVKLGKSRRIPTEEIGAYVERLKAEATNVA